MWKKLDPQNFINNTLPEVKFQERTQALLFPWTVKTHKYRLSTLKNRISVILFDLKLIQQCIYKLKDLSGQLKETNETNKYANQQNQRVDITFEWPKQSM